MTLTGGVASFSVPKPPESRPQIQPRAAQIKPEAVESTQERYNIIPVAVPDLCPGHQPTAHTTVAL